MVKVRNRSGLDFSKHELKCVKSEGLLIHHLQKPNTICDNIKYINTNGILAVTGDYGNWIFCREFNPSPSSERVSDGYWIEKLKTGSCQEPMEFDSEETAKQIKYQIRKGLKEYGYSGDQLQQMKEYLTECLGSVDDYWEYINTARNYPSFTDSESAIVLVKNPKRWLLTVFDGFEEICRRLRMQESEVNNG